jgi:hypothetical protein
MRSAVSKENERPEGDRQMRYRLGFTQSLLTAYVFSIANVVNQSNGGVAE